jgi:urease beta subunit
LFEYKPSSIERRSHKELCKANISIAIFRQTGYRMSFPAATSFRFASISKGKNDQAKLEMIPLVVSR